MASAAVPDAHRTSRFMTAPDANPIYSSWWRAPKATFEPWLAVMQR